MALRDVFPLDPDFFERARHWLDLLPQLHTIEAIARAGYQNA
jgi:hypothetical protein